MHAAEDPCGPRFGTRIRKPREDVHVHHTADSRVHRKHRLVRVEIAFERVRSGRRHAGMRAGVFRVVRRRLERHPTRIPDSPPPPVGVALLNRRHRTPVRSFSAITRRSRHRPTALVPCTRPTRSGRTDQSVAATERHRRAQRNRVQPAQRSKWAWAIASVRRA